MYKTSKGQATMIIRRFLFRTLLLSIGLTGPFARSIAAQHFSSGSSSATKFGVHEIVLKGDRPTDNPFDIEATVKFLPPSGESNAKTVQAFYDGDTTWRARVYVAGGQYGVNPLIAAEAAERPRSAANASSNNATFQQRSADFRVGPAVACRAPHRPGRARLTPMPVPA
jgi:hypothetical protein